MIGLKCTFIGSNLVGSQPFHTWNTSIQHEKCIFSAFTCPITIESIYDANFKIILAFYLRV